MLSWSMGWFLLMSGAFAKGRECAVHEQSQESEEQPDFKETKMIMVKHGALE